MGSVILFFFKANEPYLNDKRMTRFMISLEQGVQLIWQAFEEMKGGEIFVKKIPSMNILDIAKSVNENAQTVEIGIRPGEKLHEQMIGLEDAHYTYEYDEFYKILPSINDWANDPDRIGEGKRVDPISIIVQTQTQIGCP